MKVAQRIIQPIEDYSGLELRHFRLVWTVAETHGLTPAAKRLRLTPSALSHQLKALEGWVGTPLFTRATRAMRPTGAGEVMLEAAGKVLGIIGDTEERLQQVRSGRAGIVRMCTQCYTGYHWLPEVVAAFREKYPQVEVRLVADATNRWQEALTEREVDLVLTTERPADERNVLLTPTLRDEMLLVMRPDHPLAGKASVQPRDIAKENLLIYADRPEDSLLCTEVLRPAGCWPERYTTVQLTEALLALVKAGMGVAALAGWSIEPHVAAGGIVARRITRSGWTRTWYAATWPRREAGPLVMALVEELRTRLGPKGNQARIGRSK